MKKFAFIVAVFLMVGFFSSCKKNFICTCTAETSDGAPTVNIVPFNDVTKKDASFECDKLDKISGQDCELKNAN